MENQTPPPAPKKTLRSAIAKLQAFFGVKKPKPESAVVERYKEQFTEKMQETYSYLYQHSLTLFEKCIDNTIDLPRLEQMLTMLDKVNQGYNLHNASVEIGQSLTDHYVKPLIEKK